MAQQPVFVIGGRRFPVVELGQATLRDAMAIQRETGLGIDRVEVLLAETRGMSGGEMMASADHLLAFGVQIWLARRAAEPGLKFEDAIDFPLGDLEVELVGDPDPVPAGDPT